MIIYQVYLLELATPTKCMKMLKIKGIVLYHFHFAGENSGNQEGHEGQPLLHRSLVGRS